MSGKGFKKFANGIGEEITNVDVDQKRKTSKIPKLHLSFLPNSKSPKKEGGFSFFKWNNKKIDTKSTDVDVPNESQEEIISQNDESMRVSKEESLVEDNDSKRSSPFKQTLDNNEFQNVNNRVETSQVSVRSSSDAGVISSLLRGSGKLRTSPAQDYISSLGSRIGAQVIAGFKGPERRPSTDMNVSQHGEESFNTSQWSSPRFDSPRLDSPRFDYSTDASIHDANDNVRYNIPEETSKTSKSDWFSPIRSLLKKKEKQPSDPTNQQSDSRHRPVPVSSLHGANHQLDDRPHYLGSDHVDDKNMQKHRGYLAWNSLIALGFGLYLGVSILVTAQKWLFIELGINDKEDINYTNFKETMELSTFFLVFYLLSHRLFAVVVGLILRISLRKRFIPDGTFTIHFGWVSYRGPFDGSQLVFADVMWRNPPLFRRTPYLLHCKRLSVSFTLWNLGKMIFYGQEIIFDEIVIDGLVVYFDRRTTSLTENSLNLWAAIGVTNKESEKWFFRAFVKSILMAIKNRIRKNTSIVHMLKLDRLKRREKAAFSADSDDDDDDDDDGDKSSMNSEDVIQSPADGTIGRGASENSLASALESLPAGESMQEGSFTQLSSKPFSTSSSATASSLRRSRQRFGIKKGIDATLPTPTPTPVQRLPTVEFNHLIIYDLVAYPLDLLTETHSEHVFKDNSKIYLKKFTLDRDDITGKPLTKNGPRVPLPADDFGDKFGDAFGGALVKHNTYQIASIFAHSYANRILKIKAKEKRHSHAGIQKEVNNSMNPLLSSQSSSIVIGKVVAISDPVTEQST